MRDRLIDGVNWLVSESISDRSKIAIMGASYGGYATMLVVEYMPPLLMK